MTLYELKVINELINEIHKKVKHEHKSFHLASIEMQLHRILKKKENNMLVCK